MIPSVVCQDRASLKIRRPTRQSQNTTGPNTMFPIRLDLASRPRGKVRDHFNFELMLGGSSGPPVGACAGPALCTIHRWSWGHFDEHIRRRLGTAVALTFDGQ